MKKYCLFISLFILIPVVVWAWNVSMHGAPSGVAGGGGYSCSSDEFTPTGTGGQERFECGANSYDDSTVLENSGWSHTSTSDIDNHYSTSPAPLQGEHSYALTAATDGHITISGTDGDRYVAFMVRNADSTCNTSSNRVFDLAGDSNSETLCTFSLVYNSDCSNLDTAILLPTGGGTSLVVEDVATPATNFKYVKILYNNGSGSNAAWSAWYSSDGSSWNAFGSNGTNDGVQTYQADSIRLRTNRDDIIIFDDLRWDTSDIDY